MSDESCGARKNSFTGNLIGVDASSRHYQGPSPFNARQPASPAPRATRTKFKAHPEILFVRELTSIPL